MGWISIPRWTDDWWPSGRGADSEQEARAVDEDRMPDDAPDRVDYDLDVAGVAMVEAELEQLDESDPEARRLIEEVRRLLDALRDHYRQLRGERP